MRFVRLTASIFGLAFVLCTALAAPARAAACGNDGSGFAAWLEDFKREAAAAGISQRAIASGLAGVVYDRSVISHDRGQRVFRQSFEEFSGRMVPPRLGRGKQMLLRHASTISRMEERFGVPGPIVVAIWGLETDFGANNGNFPTIRSLATLAYDCRRSDKFHGELLDALRIVDRGLMNPAAMHGAWAGEIGQTQFMPSSYLKYAVDFDGDGRPDLIRSVPDVLASTANYLKGYGWQRGAPWGPGTANFNVLLEWNKSTVYSKTVAYFAQRLAGSE
jgi:lytic murein transglycosylase